MQGTRTETKILGDRIITKKLSSGMKCYIIPKVGYGEKMAALCVRFGSNDICYRLPGEEKTEIVPQGTAHFIEHKMFEQEWGDAFTAFSEGGAFANAFTDAQKTAYYFSSRDKFEENLSLLLRMVQNPFFRKEGTEKEKKIINSEITMYEDDPGWIVFFNMLKAMYYNHTVKNPIAGTVETVGEINQDTLQRCYDAFYTPENFSLVCVGDVDEDYILGEAAKLVKKREKTRAVSVFEPEPEEIFEKYIEQTMDISKPMFQLGFKQKPSEQSKEMKQMIAMGIALDILAGESSEFFRKAYEKGVLDEEPGYMYSVGEGFAFSALSGTGSQPEEAGNLLLAEIENLKTKGLSDEVFQRMKKKHLGRIIRGFNSVNALCMSQLDMAMRNGDFTERFQALKGIKLEDVQEVFEKELVTEKMVLSVVR